MRKLIIISIALLSYNLLAKTIVLTKDNSLTFKSEFTQSSTNALKVELLQFMNAERVLQDINLVLLTKESKSNEIYLLLDTPGGEITSGLEMIDFILSQPRPVHTITLFAASMGFQTVQALGTRYITYSGTLMAHKASGGFEGEFGTPGSQLDKRYNFWLNRLERLDQNTVKRTNGKQTLESFRKLFENEYWCEGQKCVNDGFADEVVNVTCGLDLSSYYVKKTSIAFAGMEIKVEYKKPECPLIGEYDIKILNNDNIFIDLYEADDIIRQIVIRELKISNKYSRRGIK